MTTHREYEIKFGTDGWRAVISDKFTFKNVEIVAQSISEWVNRHLRKKPGMTRRVAVEKTGFTDVGRVKSFQAVEKLNFYEAIFATK